MSVDLLRRISGLQIASGSHDREVKEIELEPTLPASKTDPLVIEFLKLWNLNGPVYLKFQDVGYDYHPNFCHVSAKHMVLHHEGDRIHGWGLWQFRDVIVGDFHSVWKAPDGTLTDVTPPKVGSEILFVCDPALRITEIGGVQCLYHNRTNVAETPRLWMGAAIDEDTFGLPNDQPALITYCAKLGLRDTSML